jgi:hypothetical protein
VVSVETVGSVDAGIATSTGGIGAAGCCALPLFAACTWLGEGGFGIIGFFGGAAS